MTEIIVALITGALALVGTAIGTNQGITATQKVTEVKLEELTREVREHNSFARRVPVLEEQMKIANHRITDLERGNHYEH